jgi:tripartite ATP-independent transporter DctM subunit
MVTLASVLIAFLAALLSNIPVFLVVAGCGIIAVFAFDITPLMIPQRMITGLDIPSLAAVLFFILGGEIMNSGGITERLSTVLILGLARIRAGLAYVVVLVNLIMAGVSGSATADAAATGSVMIPMMKRSGYSPAFSAVLVATASTMGPLIPPSILFIIIGSMCNVSILDLFLGGVVPGLFVAVSLIIVSYFICRRGQFGLNEEELGRVKREFGGTNIKLWVEFLLAVLMPFIILGGMRFGIFTPTEAGAVLVIYSFLVSFFIYRELGYRDIPKVLLNAALMTGNILLIVGVASILGYVAARTELIDLIAGVVRAAVQSKLGFLATINCFLLILGCFMEITTIAIVIAPILLPLAETYGINPISMGVILVFNLMVGLITPPVGMNMYITIAIARISIVEFAKHCVPFMILMILSLILVTYFSDIVILWLPNALK